MSPTTKTCNSTPTGPNQTLPIVATVVQLRQITQRNNPERCWERLLRVAPQTPDARIPPSLRKG